jgi:hypothetical protein
MMRKSDAIGQLAAALAKAQGEFGPLRKGAVNPFYKNRYADLASVMDVARVPLVDNELSITQTHAESETGHLIIETTLMHSSGEWITGHIKMPLSKNDPQGYGSATTYARRYALQAILGLAAEDDDGNAATHTNGEDHATTPKQYHPEPPQGDIISIDFVPTLVTMKTGESKTTGKSWIKYLIKHGKDEYSTFSESLAKIAKEAKEREFKVRVTYKQGQFGKDAINVVSLEIEPGKKELDI